MITTVSYAFKFPPESNKKFLAPQILSPSSPKSYCYDIKRKIEEKRSLSPFIERKIDVQTKKIFLKNNIRNKNSSFHAENTSCRRNASQRSRKEGKSDDSDFLKASAIILKEKIERIFDKFEEQKKEINWISNKLNDTLLKRRELTPLKAISDYKINFINKEFRTILRKNAHN